MDTLSHPSDRRELSDPTFLRNGDLIKGNRRCVAAKFADHPVSSIIGKARV
jgi:hypothetical protein